MNELKWWWGNKKPDVKYTITNFPHYEDGKTVILSKDLNNICNSINNLEVKMSNRRKQSFKLICIVVILYFVMTFILIKLVNNKKTCDCYEIQAKEYNK